MMKMKLSILSLLSLMVVSLVAGFYNVESVNADSKTIVVPDNFPSIQDAINNAAVGDTIYIKKGTYVENPVVNKSVCLIGEDKDATVIDVTAGLKVQSNYVNITGLTIYDGYHGITVSSNSCRISGNKITDSQVGIALLSAYDNIIAENTLQSIGLSAAIQLSYSNNNLIQNNYINSCTEGIQLREGSSNNTVNDNIVSNCQDVAIRLLGSGVGKRWYGPNGNTIMRNNISYSRVGTTVYGANNNVVSNNNYVNNTIQFSANEDYYLVWGGSRSINTIDRNYWSDYNGTDANRDGIGDTPYVIDAHNKDNSPIMSPIDIPVKLPTSSPSSPISTINTGPHMPETEPFPTSTVLIVALILVAVVMASVLLFRKHRKTAKLMQ